MKDEDLRHEERNSTCSPALLPFFSKFCCGLLTRVLYKKKIAKREKHKKRESKRGNVIEKKTHYLLNNAMQFLVVGSRKLKDREALKWKKIEDGVLEVDGGKGEEDEKGEASRRPEKRE
ncbi:Protein CBG27121 [Caenorhabditis briggsae]|uniref:Protein CBG27121 n=1 Tax=Caenorhabditis briggsae TaxID=6238 RepID=B6IHJ5_CAEBR|nr:Protein CBG27121 [Caenorhabditis briggsae]CAR99375.1 Protein CBG27121 [Caenorhabditis briggsae]